MVLEIGAGIVAALADALAFVGIEGAGLFDELMFDGEVEEFTGAGDAFNGGLATAIAEGLSMETALRFATCTAAISVTRLGSSQSMPSREEIVARMEKEFGVTL